MCGRFDQNDTARTIRAFQWTGDLFNRSQAEPRFNVSPGTFRPIMHIEDDALAVDDLWWSYRPGWAKGKIPIAVNAKIEKLASAYWRPLMTRGRAVVGASGWYEWTGEKGSKQPWHIHHHDHEPIFMLALANFGPAREAREETGFVLLTSESAGGMVDVHDRRPVVLSAADAHLWLDPDLSPLQAEELARSAALGVDEFEWYRVSTEVNRAGTDGPQLVVPIAA